MQNTECSENDTSSMRKGTSIATKCSDIIQRNDDVRADRISIVEKAMSNKKKALEVKVCLESISQGDVHGPLNAACIFEENGDEVDADFKYTNDQKHILDVVEKTIKYGKKMLFFAHSAVGTGKSLEMKK